ncbi:MAG: hypothetical protein UY35_C0005G0023 [Candidatus Saccharibacteria bacterium GW2011_GWC2_48_9]|jgi:DNA-binding ferritin-like protein (Dps family)|nr:MAG: hypothetical protein UY35_C0005G0023 [Candidatus Saccharibacteria bacterium GW2011_GWC2_48_9]HCH34186.1 hypothetical protein [Candidatus Saccharibacteria bacterium]
MSKILDRLVGSLDEKREYKKIEARARALPSEYSTAYSEIKKYIFNTSGIVTMDPLKVLVDILEEAAANNKRVLEVTGPDVAAFADELVRGEHSYHEEQRNKLNATITKRLGRKE